MLIPDHKINSIKSFCKKYTYLQWFRASVNRFKHIQDRIWILNYKISLQIKVVSNKLKIKRKAFTGSHSTALNYSITYQVQNCVDNCFVRYTTVSNQLIQLRKFVLIRRRRIYNIARGSNLLLCIGRLFRHFDKCTLYRKTALDSQFSRNSATFVMDTCQYFAVPKWSQLGKPVLENQFTTQN